MTVSPDVNPGRLTRLLLVLVLPLFISVLGCGPAEEYTEEEGAEEWETTPTVTEEAKLEYRVDSLMSENRRMRDQVDAVSAENRGLRARVAELETKLSEATSAAPAPISPFPIASGDMQSAYQAALDQFMGRNYQGAIDQFNALLQADINRDLADNCHYWIGESHYALRDYNQAIQDFQQVLTYTGSGKRPYAQLMIGNSYAALGNTSAAREAYTTLVNTYPTSSLVAKAQEKLARLQ